MAKKQQVNSKKKVKVTLDASKCINCGTCSAIAPQAFGFNDQNGKHKVLPPYDDWVEVDEQTYQQLKDAEVACPVMCIKVLEEGQNE